MPSRQDILRDAEALPPLLSGAGLCVPAEMFVFPLRGELAACPSTDLTEARLLTDFGRERLVLVHTVVSTTRPLAWALCRRAGHAAEVWEVRLGDSCEQPARRCCLEGVEGSRLGVLAGPDAGDDLVFFVAGDYSVEVYRRREFLCRLELGVPLKAVASSACAVALATHEAVFLWGLRGGMPVQLKDTVFSDKVRHLLFAPLARTDGSVVLLAVTRERGRRVYHTHKIAYDPGLDTLQHDLPPQETSFPPSPPQTHGLHLYAGMETDLRFACIGTTWGRDLPPARPEGDERPGR